ncbi:hypothetical protein CDAR_4231 [Caerostris darwini]|uniref:Uncharacterized protein n=1 Tax=Caerostris darwini TaxID=1538125 RepID=A0AAV4N5L1_9ARAC|nr:hypothetical protein CDAR_4231 [Caerostris darwini]
MPFVNIGRAKQHGDCAIFAAASSVASPLENHYRTASICHSHSSLVVAETLQSRVSVSPPLSTGTSDLLQVFVGTTSCSPDF